MRLPWLDRREEGLLRRTALLPLDLVAVGYGGVARAHRWAYEHGALPRRRLSCGVLSVGSLTVGGAGKTPTAAWLARALSARGRRVALASRGYGRSSGQAVTLVSDGSRILSDVTQAGDEALLLASHAPGVPVLVGADRGVVGLRAISAFGIELLILDDALQHHRLERDLEIMVVDAALGLGNGRVLPRGPLREARSAISRVDAVFEVDGSLPDGDSARLTRLASDARRVRARRRAVEVRMLRGGPSFSPSTLRGSRVGIFSGIGSPASFRRTLEELGAEVVAERCFRDHHRYRRADLASLRRHADVWITTEKDALKLRPEWGRGADLRVLRIELEVDDPPAFLDWAEWMVDQRLRRRPSRRLGKRR